MDIACWMDVVDGKEEEKDAIVGAAWLLRLRLLPAALP